MELSFEIIEKITKSMGEKYVKIASFFAFFGLGALLGIAAKSYLRFLIVSFIICFFTIKGLEYNHILNINWAVLNSLFGLPAKAGFSEFIEVCKGLCKTYPIQTVGAILGSILGFFKLG
jgi:uncharacterized membrane protein (Fun14 family)